MNRRIDPITFEVVRNALASTADDQTVCPGADALAITAAF